MPDEAWIAWHRGVWWLAPVPVQEPRLVGVGDVADLLGAGDVVPAVGAVVAPAATTLIGISTATVPHTLVGPVTEGGWRLEPLAGDVVHLGPIDVVLIDALARGLDLAAAASSAGLGDLEQLTARLPRLELLGVRVVPGSAPGDVASPDGAAVAGERTPAVPHDAASPGRRRGRIGRALARLGSRRSAWSVTSAIEPAPVRPAVEEEIDRTTVAEQAPEPATVVEVAPVGAELKIPVYAPWHESVGPLLSLGTLTAMARRWEGGRLGETYEVRVPETGAEVLRDLAGRRGPAILLCSDYVWSLEANLELARQALALNPEIVVLHGGPSVPKYAEDERAFFAAHGDCAHVVVRGEGEVALVELLDALAQGLPAVDHARLATIEGISFSDGHGGVVRTPDRARLADLSVLPSAYLSGEFDHIDPSAWHVCLSIETNRGCPYGCTFCDWGSATNSRIRTFPVERVAAEFEWAARRGVAAVQITDANFGIMSRDVELTRRLVEAKRSTGFPLFVSWTPAKNTKRHITGIMDLMLDAGIGVSASLSLQTIDEATLAAIDRDNISVEHYLALAAEYRRRLHPLQGDLLLGLPEQTYDSYRDDLQFMVDHQIVPRTWPVQVLPNAPMNEPSYRARHGIRADDRHLVTSTASFTEADRERMFGLRKVDVITERLGLLRHVMRYLQWDLGIPATTVMEELLDHVRVRPLAHPAVTWALEYFDVLPVAPGSWASFYEQVHDLVVGRFGLDPADPALATVLAAQRALMPAVGRRFPDTVALEHDYVAYHRSATRELYLSGRAGRPDRPLRDYGPGALTVLDDPLQLCELGLDFGGESRDQAMQGDFYVLIGAANELLSPLVDAAMPAVVTGMDRDAVLAQLPDMRNLPPVALPERRNPTSVALRGTLSERSADDSPSASVDGHAGAVG